MQYGTSWADLVFNVSAYTSRMTPEIRYARTSDGLSIAYFAIGSGPLLIDLIAPPFGNADLIWGIAEWAEGMQTAAQMITYVQCDPRGFGMSDRDVSDFPLDAMVRDLEAVADALARERFAIAAWGQTCMPALAYAAAHEERVIALALREGFASGNVDFGPYEDVPLALARDDWELYTRSIADRSQNLLSVAGLRQMQELIQRTAARDTFIRYVEQWRKWDAWDVLPRVAVPVLVTNDGGAPEEAGRRLAAALPLGSFVNNRPARGERSLSVDAVNEFLARAFASERGPVAESDADGAEPPALTPREIEVLRLLVAGKSGREIAAELVLSPRTVERHVANIYSKTNTHGRAQLAAYAVRHRLG